MNPTQIQSRTRERARFLLCEHCHAPVDRQQRYCVSCGARQSHAQDPATAYFAAAARSRRTGAPPQRPEGGVLRSPLLALFLVLLPLGVATGVLVGRSGSAGNDERLIAALERQQPILAAPNSGTLAGQGASGASSHKRAKKATPAPVLAHTAYGTVHKVAGSRVTVQQIQQDKQIVQKINRTVGKSYVDAQKGLPDTIAVGGGSSGAGSTSSQSAAERLGEH
jgi:hypothetical protein